MPPKRKSQAEDGGDGSSSPSSLTDFDDAEFSPPPTPPPVPATPAPPPSKRTRQTLSSVTIPPKSKYASSQKPGRSAPRKKAITYETGSLAPYQAKPPVPGVSYTRQSKACQHYRTLPDTFERCLSCIQKQSVLGGCRFHNLRAFRTLSNGVAVEEEKTESEIQKGKKNAVAVQDETTVDFTDLTFLGNQPEDYIPFSSLKYTPPTQEISPPADKNSKKKTRAESPIRLKRSTRNLAPIDPPATKITQPSPDPDSIIEIRRDTSPETLIKQSSYSLSLIAPIFASQLLRERTHEDIHLGLTTTTPSDKSWKSSIRPVVRMIPTPEARSMCDFCATTIFLGSYLCGSCGCEYCLGCWEEWNPSPDDPFKHLERTVSSCSRRRRHCRDSMMFITRAAHGEIDSLLPRVQEYASEATRAGNIPPPLEPIPIEVPIIQQHNDPAIPVESSDTTDEASPAIQLNCVQLPEFLPLPKIPIESLTTDRFQSHWLNSPGVPLVVTGLLDRFSLSWDDKYFIRKYGRQTCLLHDTSLRNPDQFPINGFVEDFFLGLNDARLRRSYSGKAPKVGSWKLKDWPPQADFSSVFPALFQDFENAVPSPEYSTRLGWLNLASRGPVGWVRPDLGPKMYCAYPAVDFLPKERVEGQKVVVKGTTNLHLDMTDAVNIMVYTSPIPQPTPKHFYPPPPEGEPIGAIWDIFPPSTAARLREYLRKKFPESLIDDPIHRQVFYLDESDLRKLADQRGVRSWRIYQKPGEAVYIPAGCPHQVRNVRGGVKVAVDFLSPENVGVCKELLEEGRRLAGVGGGVVFKETTPSDDGDGGEEETETEKKRVERIKSLGKREDVLQLWNCLYYSWSTMEKVVVGPQ
ncbi:hypothetical protein DFH27DRAFT_570624 [Peziza echinospora]|nr:hypothetical protein DFH27DRAFT_570624 [Peziza echinospora]